MYGRIITILTNIFDNSVFIRSPQFFGTMQLLDDKFLCPSEFLQVPCWSKIQYSDRHDILLQKLFAEYNILNKKIVR